MAVVGAYILTSAECDPSARKGKDRTVVFETDFSRILECQRDPELHVVAIDDSVSRDDLADVVGEAIPEIPGFPAEHYCRVSLEGLDRWPAILVRSARPVFSGGLSDAIAIASSGKPCWVTPGSELFEVFRDQLSTLRRREWHKAAAVRQLAAAGCILLPGRPNYTIGYSPKSIDRQTRRRHDGETAARCKATLSRLHNEAQLLADTGVWWVCSPLLRRMLTMDKKLPYWSPLCPRNSLSTLAQVQVPKPSRRLSPAAWESLRRFTNSATADFFHGWLDRWQDWHQLPAKDPKAFWQQADTLSVVRRWRQVRGLVVERIRNLDILLTFAQVREARESGSPHGRVLVFVGGEPCVLHRGDVAHHLGELLVPDVCHTTWQVENRTHLATKLHRAAKDARSRDWLRIPGFKPVLGVRRHQLVELLDGWSRHCGPFLGVRGWRASCRRQP